MTTAVTARAMTVASGDSTAPSDLGGLSGLVLQLIDALGEWGVGLMLFVETVFPPIPSEVILPLAGFLAGAGQMNLVLVLVLATIGSYLGALVLYWLGAKIGFERTTRWFGKLPLVDEDDFRKAAGWFHRHGKSAVFFGRFVPIVRSLISLPAGADRMHLGTFSVFTIIASGIWNSALVLLGAAFGSQYDQVEAYTEWIDRVLYVAIAVVVVTFVVRRVRRVRAERRTGSPDDHDDRGSSSPAVGGARGRRRAEPARD
ncbi:MULTISPECIES: DedA family protein [Curtobacterium]|uniref:DedA family protein n=1 Tax=Curtobacterium TaxID=2034 RepID=UPI00217EA292|nr:DedA family protein [Curtobacterium flaccumfaciens]MCS6581691.1 DedA family protein [Curtobacterium flaccumfaciens pv. beticola]MCS6587805.1 DedA family protein [Curtobacterium flaccumfaciens pv. flaccumfaciens]